MTLTPEDEAAREELFAIWQLQAGFDDSEDMGERKRLAGEIRKRIIAFYASGEQRGFSIEMLTMIGDAFSILTQALKDRWEGAIYNPQINGQTVLKLFHLLRDLSRWERDTRYSLGPYCLLSRFAEQEEELPPLDERAVSLLRQLFEMRLDYDLPVLAHENLYWVAFQLGLIDLRDYAARPEPRVPWPMPEVDIWDDEDEERED